MSFKIVILGDGSTVASRLTQILSGQPLVFSYVDDMCLAEPTKFALASAWADFLIQEQATIVVNLQFPVTKEEADKSLPIALALAQGCANINLPVIQLSSFRVFGDEYLDKGWGEADTTDPSDSFGKSLVKREHGATLAAKHIVLRLSWLLDAFDESLLEVTASKLMTDETPMIVSDHKYGRPVSAIYVANTVFALIQQILADAQNWGIFNVHSSDLCSEAEFCDYVLRILSTELDQDFCALEVAAKGDERSITLGSANLQGRRITDSFGVQLPSWRSGFKTLVKKWLLERSL